MLRWIFEGCPACAEPSESYKSTALALQNRRLVEVTKRGGVWRASVTDAGRHHLDHGDYPRGHFLAKRVKEPPPRAANQPGKADEPRSQTKGRRRRGHSPPLDEDVWIEVDSPAGVRARGVKPRGDNLHADGPIDPWDKRILVSVKEAAWLLSISEHEIRRAVTNGDIQRVFIGEGTTRYRIVYGSLLAWVNDMPREPSIHLWRYR